MRVERFAGSHGAIGRQRGAAFGQALRLARSRFTAWPPQVRRRMDDLVPRFEAALGRTAPELTEELRGVADGAGLAYAEVLRLELAEEVGAPGGCSQIALRDGAGAALSAKSEDAGFGRTYAVTEIRPDGGYAQLHIGAVHWLVSSGGGINEAGLCIGQSSVFATDRAEGLPRLALLRLALERCAAVGEAAAFLEGQPMALRGLNFLLADAGGELAVVERSPSRGAVRRPDGAPAVCCTNHYLDPGMRAVERGCTGAEVDLEGVLAQEANTRQRYGRLWDFARRHAGGSALRPALEDLLASHGPGGLYQHGAMCTTLSLVMDPRARRLWATDGPPCSSRFQAYGFGGAP